MSVTPKLNPTAPTFNFKFGRTSKADKLKAREKVIETTAESDGMQQAINTSSPVESRKSRDTPSIHTQHSVPESHESLERSSSHTPSEMANLSANSSKDKESVINKLLMRKGSSSKFSISSKSSFFGSKKGNSRAANSDRNASVERDGSFDEYGEDGGRCKFVRSRRWDTTLGWLEF
jgi:hypothetical protein